MKTYKATTEKPRLVIEYDDGESPRQWDNLGYFYTKDRGYHSPDGNTSKIYQIMTDTGEEAESQAQHIEMMKERINNETDEEVLFIFPVVKYEHSGVIYRLGTAQGFDYSNNGFYFVVKNKETEEMSEEKIIEIIKGELETYNKWLNGDVYSFVLYDEKGEVVDSCGGFYEIEDIREYLPEDWKGENLEEYIKY